jgi:hypothetical protein
MRIRHAILPVAVFALATFGAQKPAHAGDIAAAEALFNEGQKLFAAGQIHQACEKFGESYSQDPAVGTMINLARCHEKEGKTASAWGEYKTVEALAARSNQKEREQFAHDEAAKLEPTLHKLVLNVKFPVEGIEITRNGTPIGKGQWGSEVPVDPGDVVLKATAPGKKDWSMPVHLAAGPGVDHFDVPKLEDAPVEKPPPGKDQIVVQGNSGGTQRIIGLALAGAGVVAGGVAAVFQITAISQVNQRDKAKSDPAYNGQAAACNNLPDTSVDKSGNALCPLVHTFNTSNSAAHNDQNIAIGFMAAGGALIIAGVVLYFTAPSAASAPKAEKASWQLVPAVGPKDGGLVLVGSF